jgi:hypothetical protein
MADPSRPSLQSLLGFSATIKVVDIGANPIDGEPPYAPLLASGCATIVGFEPNQEALAQLNARKGPTETYLPHAVADGRRHTLHICAAPGMTSLLEPNPAVLSLFRGFPEWGTVVGREEIDTVQLMVFENAVERLKSALVVHTEVEFLPMYKDQPLFSDVDQFLRRQDFMLHRFNPLVSRIVGQLGQDSDPYEGLSQLFWADAIFVRDFQHFDLLGVDQLLRLAEILHSCYASYDLALHALQAHDRQSGTVHGETYRGILLRARQAMANRSAAPR